ncbi:hypothetical protein [Nonomuraea sp. NPDC002799]
MIIKAYRADGSPDVRNWRVQCDGDDCFNTAPMLSSADWFITTRPKTPIYCPWCMHDRAYDLITSALRCPRCQAAELRFWDEDDYIYSRYGPHYAGCCYCAAVLIVTASRDISGWLMP